MAAAEESLFGDDLGFINTFNKVAEKPNKTVSSLDILNEFL